MINKLLGLDYLIKRFDRAVLQNSFQEALRKAFDFANSKPPLVSHENRAHYVLKNEPVIVVANHPYIFEHVALISSLPNRNNIYLTIYSIFTNISKNADKHLIPMYIHHNVARKHTKAMAKVFNLFFPSVQLSKSEEKQKNIQSIKTAAQKFKLGGLVIMFPNPQIIKKSPKWFSGIGHLAKEIGENKGYIIKAHIQGTSAFDFIRLIPKSGKLMPRIKICFSEPQPIKNAFQTGNHPKEITAFLEEEYNRWVAELKK